MTDAGSQQDWAAGQEQGTGVGSVNVGGSPGARVGKPGGEGERGAEGADSSEKR